MPSAQAFESNDINYCTGHGLPVGPGPKMPMEEVNDPGWCANFVGVFAQIDTYEIVENTTVDMMDLRLANRTANAYVAWQRNAAAREHAADLEKAKKAKPTF